MDDFDVVVVGSGFGGSVTAYRLASAGYSVCVLERGRPYPPNSFARSPYSMDRAFWDPTGGHTGLYDVWSFGHMDGIVSAGLGGGSLIYANVLIRKDENWFVRERDGHVEPWPVSRADLDPHYADAEKMLNGQVFPMDSPLFADVRKAAEFKRAAQEQGFEVTTHDHVDAGRRQWYLPMLAVTFHNEGRPPVPGETIREEVRNLHDRDRQTCRLTGECDLGCNYGSKNSLDYNYLTLALAHGAEIRTLCDVKTLEQPDRDGIVVAYRHYESTDSDDGEIAYQDRSVRGRHVVVSAGTFGTNLLLQRNRGAFPGMSRQLGRGFSGNGDILSLVIGAKEEVAGKRRNRVLDPSSGPVITSTLRSPDVLDGAGPDDRGFYLQDAGYPVFLDWLVQTANVSGNVRAVAGMLYDRVRTHVFHHGQPHLAPDLEKLFGDTHLSSGSMPLLGMGRDVPSGVFSLDANDQLSLDWDKRASTPFFDDVRRTSERLAESLDGEYVENPVTSLFSRFITVHALGGASMGATAADGVVDPWGRVHNHPRLHVADGSVMPGPVGANPSLTIAALADRFADQLVEDLAAAH